MIAAVAMGRFTGPTVEHEKLLDLLMAQEADVRFIIVFGPADTKLSVKNPQTVMIKQYVINRLYPSAWVRSFPNPFVAFEWLNHLNQLRLVRIVAGVGRNGITGADEGGSLEEYIGCARRAGVTCDIEGIPQERGEVSGTKLREAILSGATLDQIRPMMHSRLSDEQISRFIKSLHEINDGRQRTT